jgi:membrane protein CcdC involved in cytochrome C biogenesis
MFAKTPPWVVFPGMFFVVAIGFFYIFDACLSTTRAAARRLPGFAAILVVTMLALLALFGSMPASWRGSVSIILSAVCVGLLWAYFLVHHKKAKAGRALLYVGRSRSHVAAGLVACLAVGLLIFEILKTNPGLEGVCRIVPLLSLGALNLFLGYSKLKITEQGIFAFGTLITWERIKSYKWEGRKGRILTLETSRRLPLFRQISLAIPARYRDSVDELLLQNISDSTLGSVESGR